MLRPVKSSLLLLVLFALLAGSVAADSPVGDLDADLKVTWDDLWLFAQQWLDNPGGSANLDGINGVNGSDFSLLAQNWYGGAGFLVINEFMASNSSTIEDPNEPGDTPDWIEIYNSGSTAIDMGGMYLTDDLGDPTWQIPSGISIGSGEYLLFWADGEDEQGNTHTNFKLGAAGEQVGLFDTDGSTVIDSITFGEQSTDYSYGRYPDANDNWRFMGIPTPGSANNAGSAKRPEFSRYSGVFTAPFSLIR